MDVRAKAEQLLDELERFDRELRDCRDGVRVYRRRVMEILASVRDPGEAEWLFNEIRSFLANEGVE